MPIEHSHPTNATVKYLYAHAFRCAYGGCARPLYRVDEQTGVRTLNSRVCHICARREGGPRWDPQQSSDQNRSEANLVLMCVEHASAIDEPSMISAYTITRLLEWKAAQLNEYDQLKQGWALDTKMAKEVLQASSANVEVAVSNSVLHLGGQGGQAPGAGGGGGGAIGRHAHAGRGGDGGTQRIDSGEFTTPHSSRSLPPEPTIKAERGVVDRADRPGAGGGGGGAIGEGAVGGDGGGGGESVEATIDVVALRKAGFERIEYVVGTGGNASRMPGQRPKDGEDTIVNFVSKDGAILKSIRAAGGKAPLPRLPDGVEELSAADIIAGFRVSVLMTVNAAELRDGLYFVLGGDWGSFPVARLPCDAAYTVLCTAHWGLSDRAVAKGLFLSLLSPIGREASTRYLIVPADDPAPGFRRWIQSIGTTFDAEGTWRLRVHSGGFLLAEVPIYLSVASPKQ